MEHRDPGTPEPPELASTIPPAGGSDAAGQPDAPGPDDAPNRPRGSAGRGQGRPPDESRRRRGGPERRQAGFNDGVERAFCARYRVVPPPDFPVQHRIGSATLRPAVVARRPEALLLCDSSHAGDHLWPDHEPVVDAEWAPGVDGNAATAP